MVEKNPLWLILVVVIPLPGCFQWDSRNSVARTYPGTMSVLSRYSKPITIVDCEGLDFAQPDGVIVPLENEIEYPQKSYTFPRLGSLPDKIVIRWRVIEPPNEKNTWSKFPDDMRQEVELPKDLLGAMGELRFVLDENGKWSCALVKDRNE